jgi:hypothetical protein
MEKFEPRPEVFKVMHAAADGDMEPAKRLFKPKNVVGPFVPFAPRPEEKKGAEATEKPAERVKQFTKQKAVKDEPALDYLREWERQQEDREEKQAAAQRSSSRLDKQLRQ